MSNSSACDIYGAAIREQAPPAPAGRARATRPVRLRISLGGDVQLVYVLRAPAGLAACQGDRSAHSPGLCPVYAGFGGCPFPPGGRDQCSVGQLEHAYPGGLVCHLSAGGSLAHFAEAGFPLYAQAWQLAQDDGNRVRGRVDPMAGSTVGRPGEGPLNIKRLCKQREGFL
jgi:hypothetical protein